MIIKHNSNNHLITNFSSLELLVTEISAVLFVYPLRLPVIFLVYLKFPSVFALQESQLIDKSNCIIIKYCYSNHLIPISVLYDFWFLRNTRFLRYTPSIFCDFSLIFKGSSIFEQHKSLTINVSYYVVLGCYHSNHLLQTSALYGFWLLSYKRFCRYTPYIGL